MRLRVLLPFAAAACVASADVTISEDTTLAADADWRDQGTLVVTAGATLNLAGHTLQVAGLAGDGAIDGAGVPTYKYYRFKVENTRGIFLQISELKLFNGETDVTGSRIGLYYDSSTVTDGSVDGLGAGQTTPGAETWEKLVDGNLGTKWLDFRSHPGYGAAIRDAAWVTLEFAEKTPVTRYEWYTANDTHLNPARNPSAWRFQGSDDNATWTDLDVQTERDDLTTASMQRAYTGVPSTGAGTLHIDVPEGVTSENTSVALMGALALVKDGAGEFVMRRGGHTYAGGTVVAAGTLSLPMSGDGNEYSPVRMLNPFGADPQPVRVCEGAVFDLKGNYDSFKFATVLDGGTYANYAKDMTYPDYGTGAPYKLTQDAFGDFPYSVSWGDANTDLEGHTLTITLADNKYFYLKRPMSNGRVVLGNAANQTGRFVSYAATDNRTVDFDIAANFEIKQDMSVRNLVTRQPGAWGWNAVDKTVFVYGTFAPMTDYFPNVELQDQAVLDLTARTEAWAVESRDLPGGDAAAEPYRCRFADAATVTIDVRGRELALGEQLVSWETMPSNFSTLTFLINDGSEDPVAAAVTANGIFYGSDPNATTVAIARWTGAVNAVWSNPANWVCENAAGVVLEDVLPAAESFVLVTGTVAIQLPAGSGFVCKGFEFGNLKLAADCDLSGAVAVLDGSAQIDLAGHTLTLGGFTGLGEVVDSVGGGSLVVAVPEGAEVVNAATKLNGAFSLVKTGAGTLVMSQGAQAYTGGTRVMEGTLKPGVSDTQHPFGRRGAQIAVAEGATFDASGCAFGSTYVLSSTGGRLRLSSTGTREMPRFADFHYNNHATQVAENEIQLTRNEGNSLGSAYWTKRVNPALPWKATFTYKTVEPNGPADGFAFILHNAPLTALGGTGGAIGVNGIVPSIGTAYNIYNDDGAGWIEDGNKYNMTAALNGVALDQGADIVVEYDGVGQLTQTLTRGGAQVTFSRVVDLGARLGSSAWIGFTAACGGASCDQRIQNFTFETKEVTTFDLTPSAENWRVNYDTVLEAYAEQPAIRLTDLVNSQRGSAAFLQRLPTDHDFVLSGTYLMADGSGNPADGAAFLFHAGTPDACGGAGGARGFSDYGFPTAVGWAFNLYNAARLDFVRNGAVQDQWSLNGTGIALREKNPARPVDFEIASRNGKFSIKLVQGETTYTVEKDVSLYDVFQGRSVYFSLTGATGGETARQYVYNLAFKLLDVPEEQTLSGGYGTLRVGGRAALDLVQPAADTTTIAHLALVDDATLAVQAAGAADADYDLVVGTISFDAELAKGKPTLTFAPNGAGAGTLGFGGSVVYTRAPRTLKVVGSVTRATDEKIKLVVPVVKGALPLLDLKEAPGLTADDFELVTETSTPCELHLWGDILYAISSNGLILYFK